MDLVPGHDPILVRIGALKYGAQPLIGDFILGERPILVLVESHEPSGIRVSRLYAAARHTPWTLRQRHREPGAQQKSTNPERGPKSHGSSRFACDLIRKRSGFVRPDRTRETP
jgi:hypothetical protein